MNRRWNDLLAELTAEPTEPGSPAAGLSSSEAEAVLRRLEGHLAPAPSAADTEALIARLRPLLPRPEARRFRAVGLSREPLALFLRSQRHLFRPLWWLASLAFVLLGLLLEPLFADAGLSPAVIAPPLVIGGLLYGFRSLRGAALELELSCPVTPVHVTLVRILVPLGYYLLLGAIPGLAAGGAARLFLGWTAALLLFTGLMLTLTLSMSTTTAAALATGLWGLLTALQIFRLSPFGLPGGTLWTPMQVSALALGLLLLAFGLREERLYRWAERGEQ